MDPPGAMAIALPRCTSRITGLWPLASPKPVPEPCQYDTTNLDSIAGCGLGAVGWVLGAVLVLISPSSLQIGLRRVRSQSRGSIAACIPRVAAASQSNTP
jgi:hypothetical protein